jgi:hypothetical protein
MSDQEGVTTWPLPATPSQVSPTRFRTNENNVDTLLRSIKTPLIDTNTTLFTLRQPVGSTELFLAVHTARVSGSAEAKRSCGFV